MQREHDEFRALIRDAVGAKVYRLHDLLMETLQKIGRKTALFSRLMESMDSESFVEDFLARYSTAECASILVAGIKVKELRKKMNGSLISAMEKERYIIHPSPNLYFMRDPAAVVQAGVINSHMKFSGRQRESGLLKVIFQNHPDFKSAFASIYPPQKVEELPTIEGGDVIVLSARALAIGCSERTDEKALNWCRNRCSKHSQVERVYQVELPSKRNFHASGYCFHHH
jgi:arginine deiminase